MSLGTLSIDLEARLAKLEEGMTKATRMLQKQSDQMAHSFDAVGKSFKTLVGYFGAREIVTMATNLFKGVDALNDFSDATGTSIENASALEDIALRTGTAFSTVEGAVVKFNAALSASKKGSDQAAVFEKLGLSVERLKSLDPAQALLETAKALEGFADDGDKARIVAELFGKSVAEVAPLLKDLAEKGALNATVTTEQAKAVEKFNQNISSLQKDVLDLSRTMIGPAVEGMNAYIAKMKEASKEGRTLQTVHNDLAAQLLKLAPPQVQAIAMGLRLMTRDKAAPLPEFSDAAGGGRGFVNPALVRPGIGGLPDKPGAPGKADTEAKRMARERLEAMILQQKQYFEFLDDMQDEQDDRARESHKADIAANKDRVDAMTLQWKQYFQFLDDEQEREDEAARIAANLEKRTDKVSDAARDLGMTFSSAFEDAILNGEKFGDVLKSLDKDITRILLREIVTKPLAEGVQGFVQGMAGGKGSGTGFDWGSLISSWFAGSFATGGYVPPGQWGLMGERGPEPVFGGRTGVTVLPNGAMGGGQNVTVNVNSGGGSRMTAMQQGETIGRQVRMAMARNG